MNFEELSKIIAEETGQKVCVICGMPFKSRNAKQKTCGNDDCRHAWKLQHQRDYSRQKFAEDPDEWRKRNREAQQKYRDKFRRIDTIDANYKRLEERYKKVEEANKHITGIDYGKRQMERTLAMIPKIDVNIVGGKKHDDVHDQDNAE